MSNNIKKLQRLVNNGTISIGERTEVEWFHEQHCKIDKYDLGCDCDPRIEVNELTASEYSAKMSTISGIDTHGIDGEIINSTELN